MCATQTLLEGRHTLRWTYTRLSNPDHTDRRRGRKAAAAAHPKRRAAEPAAEFFEGMATIQRERLSNVSASGWGCCGVWCVVCGVWVVGCGVVVLRWRDRRAQLTNRGGMKLAGVAVFNVDNGGASKCTK